MFKFTEYLKEDANEEKLTHLEHPEHHPINAGEKGFHHAFSTLKATHEALKGEHPGDHFKIGEKMEGSPSIVAGHHPETGKFFVGTKGVFNKEPKLNYTPADIQANHGHAPGLVNKLNAALKNLPKVMPKEGVYQGDIMHAGVAGKSNPHGDVQSDTAAHHFTPNTITYSHKKNTPEGEKIKNSKVGVAFHTAYHGPSLEHMKASYNADTSHFGSHPDVHLMSTKFEPTHSTYTPEAQKEFTTHLNNAVKSHNKLKDYSHQEGHQEHMKTYTNSLVGTNTPASVEGYRQHLSTKLGKEVEKVKMPKTKEIKTAHMNQMVGHVDAHAKEFGHSFDVYNHLEKAKDVLAHTMNTANYDYGHSINGKKTNPEGHVVALNNRPTKIVNKAEFTAANKAKHSQ
jgi:hypothetical protein